MLFPDRIRLVSCLLFVTVPGLFPFPAIADGGALRLSVQKGSYQVAVFTSPTPLRAGPVDMREGANAASVGEQQVNTASLRWQNRT